MCSAWASTTNSAADSRIYSKKGDFYESPFFHSREIAMLEMPHCLNPVSSDFCCEHSPEPVPPEAHRFIGDVDTPFVQQSFDIAQR